MADPTDLDTLDVDPFDAPRAAPVRHPDLKPLHVLEPQPLTWLSRGRLAARKLTLLEGASGLGKSTLICDWAAHITRGEALPDGDPGEPRYVLFLAAEDGLADVILPRLAAAGADLNHVAAIVCDADRPRHTLVPVIPADVPYLTDMVRFLDAALVVIDPLAGILDQSLNPDRPQHLRRALDPLATMAARTGAALLITRHPGHDPVRQAHVGLLLAPDPDDPTRRILASTKANLAAPPPSLAFRLEPAPGADVARITMLGPSPHTAGELIHPPSPAQRTERDAAKAWLTHTLADGPLAARNVEALAKRAGFTPITLRRARENLGIISKQMSHGPRSSYFWSLPPSTESAAP